MTKSCAIVPCFTAYANAKSVTQQFKTAKRPAKPLEQHRCRADLAAYRAGSS
ncbi:MAG: hypothetical protein ACLU9R_04095 [Faecalibacterium sp.]